MMTCQNRQILTKNHIFDHFETHLPDEKPEFRSQNVSKSVIFQGEIVKIRGF